MIEYKRVSESVEFMARQGGLGVMFRQRDALTKDGMTDISLQSVTVPGADIKSFNLVLTWTDPNRGRKSFYGVWLRTYPNNVPNRLVTNFSEATLRRTLVLVGGTATKEIEVNRWASLESGYYAGADYYKEEQARIAALSVEERVAEAARLANQIKQPWFRVKDRWGFLRMRFVRDIA